jgi:hypothetical protein
LGLLRDLDLLPNEELSFLRPGIQRVHLVVLTADVHNAPRHHRAGVRTSGAVDPADVAGGGVKGVHLVVAAADIDGLVRKVRRE